MRATVAVLCCACFLAGRFLPGQTPSAPAAAKDATTFEGRRLLTEVVQQQQEEEMRSPYQPQHDPSTDVGDSSSSGGGGGGGGGSTNRPGGVEEVVPVAPPPPPLGFEGAVHSSGLLRDVPPLDPADSGQKQYSMQPVQQLSMQPRLFLWPNFLTPSQAQHIVDIATARLAPSMLALNEHDKEANHEGVRTSQGTFMGRSEDPVLAEVEDKIAAMTGIPVENGELFNILRYREGQAYQQHYDYFPQDMYGKKEHNRMATVLVYLTTVEEGGETIFPAEGKYGIERLDNGTIDYVRCDLGFKYKPRAGDALLFYSTKPDLTLDRHSLHGGCAVVKGTKFVMTKWMWDSTYTTW